MTDRTDTRRQLVEMRKRLLDGLGERLDAGTLAMLANVQSALAAIDAEAAEVASEPMAPPE